MRAGNKLVDRRARFLLFRLVLFLLALPLLFGSLGRPDMFFHIRIGGNCRVDRHGVVVDVVVSIGTRDTHVWSITVWSIRVRRVRRRFRHVNENELFVDASGPTQEKRAEIVIRVGVAAEERRQLVERGEGSEAVSVGMEKWRQ